MFKLIVSIAALLSTSYATSLDPMVAKVGEMCGADYKYCEAGTVCVGGGLGGRGICHPEAKIGDNCGGDEQVSAVCVAGSKCSKEDNICHPLSGKGGRCGGSSRYYTYVCNDGLSCVGDTPYLPGKCQ